MNLFLLSTDHKENARWHCDKHVVKMVLELVQMLYTCWQINSTDNLPRCAPLCKSSGQRGYKKISNPKHPMAVWVRASKKNYMFTVKLAAALALEYRFRYDRDHGCADHVVWLAQHVPIYFPEKGLRPVPQCMPDEYKVPGDTVQAYRNYYIGEKARFAAWAKKDRVAPDWFIIK